MRGLRPAMHSTPHSRYGTQPGENTNQSLLNQCCCPFRDRRLDHYQLAEVLQGEQPHKFVSSHDRQSGAAFPAHAFERLVQWVGDGDGSALA